MITTTTAAYVTRRFSRYLVLIVTFPFIGLAVVGLNTGGMAAKGAGKNFAPVIPTPIPSPVNYNDKLQRYEAQYPMRVAVLSENDAKPVRED